MLFKSKFLAETQITKKRRSGPLLRTKNRVNYNEKRRVVKRKEKQNFVSTPSTSQVTADDMKSCYVRLHQINVNEISTERREITKSGFES